MILVDTSVWVDHLHKGNAALAQLLLDEQVLTHPWVIGELACGNLRNRREILALLAAFPSTTIADFAEVMALIENHKLHGRGLGWVDTCLLASARLTGCRLWTLDQPLRSAAVMLDCGEGHRE